MGQSLSCELKKILRQFEMVFSCVTQLGNFVRKGEEVASISETYAQVVVSIKATNPGHLIGVNNNPVVNVGYALLDVGEE